MPTPPLPPPLSDTALLDQLASLLRTDPDKLRGILTETHKLAQFSPPQLSEATGAGRAAAIFASLEDCRQLAQTLEWQASSSSKLSHTLEHLQGYLTLLVLDYENLS